MAEIEHEGGRYRFSRMSAMDQAWVLSILRPVLTVKKPASPNKVNKDPPPGAVGDDVPDWLFKLVAAAEQMSEDDVKRFLRITLGTATRLEGLIEGAGSEWLPLWDSDAAMPLLHSLDGIGALNLAAQIAVTGLRRYFDYEPIEFEQTGKNPFGFHPVYVPGNLDWLTLPVRRGMISYDKLLDGTVDLYDIALMNDLLSVDAENSARAHAAAEEDRKTR